MASQAWSACAAALKGGAYLWLRSSSLPAQQWRACAPCTHFQSQARHYAHPPDRLKVWNPTSPGQRGRVTVDRYNLWKGGPLKELTKGLSKHGGRNNSGRISIWHRGGGAKRLYRMVDFYRNSGQDGIIQRIEYDPNRSARIALVAEQTPGDASVTKYKYIVAPAGLGEGDVVSSRPGAPIKPGMTLRLRDMPSGTVVHNVELVVGRGAQMCRAAGTSATLVKTGPDGVSLITLPSGEMRKVSGNCRATVGTVSNPLHKNRKHGKAGIRRHMGFRPTVRALAMNPRDHPASGPGKKPRKTPWGKLFMGVKTRNKKALSNQYIALTRHTARKLKAR